MRFISTRDKLRRCTRSLRTSTSTLYTKSKNPPIKTHGRLPTTNVHNRGNKLYATVAFNYEEISLPKSFVLFLPRLSIVRLEILSQDYFRRATNQRSSRSAG